MENLRLRTVFLGPPLGGPGSGGRGVGGRRSRRTMDLRRRGRCCSSMVRAGLTMFLLLGLVVLIDAAIDDAELRAEGE